jgi:hypothetical protein
MSMILDVDNGVPYLIERGYLDAAAVVEGDVTVVSASRRNRNLRVTRRDGSGYLLKQADDASSGASDTLRTEAAFYALCWSDEHPEARAMRACIPRLVGRESDDDLLIIELVRGAGSLRDQVARLGSAEFLTAVGRATGTALGTFHAAFRHLVRRPGVFGSRLSKEAHWVLWVHRPGPEILASLSAANMQTLRILQGDAELSRHLDRLRRGWQVDTLIHCDIKADNLLVRDHEAAAGASDPGATQITIVDWELVQLGDAAWDVGAVLKDFIAFWIGSMPVAAGVAASEMAGKAEFPLAGFHAGLRSMWQAYRTAAGLDVQAADALLRRAVEYAAACLVQLAYELSQRASGLSNHAVMMLQVAANVLRDPAGAAIQLFGLPLRYTRHE